MFNKRFWYYLLGSAILLACDQGTKWLAKTYLAFLEPHVVWSMFNLTLSYNTGAAFSFLSDAGGWQHYFFVSLGLAASVGLIYGLWHTTIKTHAIAYALILSGALGNVIDRLAYGQVTDFLQFHVQHWYWPTFNLADIWICAGAGLLLFYTAR